MQELTDEMVVDHCPPPAKTPDVSGEVRIPGRHVANVAKHPDGRLAVITWSSPEIDPGLLNPALHVVENGMVTDLGATPADACDPVWWGDEIVYLALTPPHLQGGNAVFDQRHRNLTEGMPACPIELVQDDGNAPIMVVATGLDTEFHRLDQGLLDHATGAQRPRHDHAHHFDQGLLDRATETHRPQHGHAHHLGQVCSPASREHTDRAAAKPTSSATSRGAARNASTTRPPTDSTSTGSWSSRSARPEKTDRSVSSPWSTAARTTGGPTTSSSTGCRRHSGSRIRESRAFCPTPEAGSATATSSRPPSRDVSARRSGTTSRPGSTC
nr:hypothetical protein [Lentzea indica]